MNTPTQHQHSYTNTPTHHTNPDTNTFFHSLSHTHTLRPTNIGPQAQIAKFTTVKGVEVGTGLVVVLGFGVR